jgi:hypothetical protein
MTPDWQHLRRTPDWRGLWHYVWRIFDHFEYVGTFLLGGVAVAARRYWQKLRETRAAGWPSAEATIQSATVKAHEGYEVQLTYRYYARQEYRYGKYSHQFRKKEAAEQFAEAIRGRSLQIRYREDNPDVSVLMERDLELTGALHHDRTLRA